MRLVFFGTPDFAVPSLVSLLNSAHQVAAVVAQPDRPAGRGMRLQSPPVIELARQRGIPTLQPEKVRDPAFLEEIAAMRPDLAVVIAYGRILPSSLLRVPRHGFINVHASLLPKYRGAAPIQRAIADGQRETGVTIMRVDEELDHGPILAAEPLAIGPDEHAPSLSRRLASAGAAKLVEVIDLLQTGGIRETAQDHQKATYAPKIEKDEGRVEWRLPAIAIFDRFRAFDPWPGIFATFGGEVVKLTDVRAEQDPSDGDEGTVVDVTAQGIGVGTSRGTLRILELQRAGKRPVDAGQFARASGLRPGARFE